MNRVLCFTIAISASLCASSWGKGKPSINTQDINNFWAAFDSLENSSDSAHTIQSLYIDKGSSVLKHFIKKYGYTAKHYVSLIRAYPEYWKSIRHSTVAISSRKQEIQEALKAIEAIYSQFNTPDVYFLIGCLQSGGTIISNQIIVGSEIAAASRSTVTHELPPWQKAVMEAADDIVAMVAHEAIHTQQKFIGLSFIWGYLNHRLLTMSLSEGAADFVSELAIGQHINKGRMEFGIKHEEALWKEFKKGMMENDVSKWLYNGGNATTPDMGYFIGYQICKSFYEASSDKQKAIEQIIRMDYSKRFLRRSMYENKFR